jgi:hypothetical protein
VGVPVIRLGIAAALAVAGISAGAVTYSETGDTKVIVDDHGTQRTVTLKGAKPDHVCDGDASVRIEAYDKELAQLTVVIDRAERKLTAINQRYPDRQAPVAVADRYNAILKTYKTRTTQFNSEVEKRNAILDGTGCEKADGA